MTLSKQALAFTALMTLAALAAIAYATQTGQPMHGYGFLTLLVAAVVTPGSSSRRLPESTAPSASGRPSPPVAGTPRAHSSPVPATRSWDVFHRDHCPTSPAALWNARSGSAQ